MSKASCQSSILWCTREETKPRSDKRQETRSDVLSSAHITRGLQHSARAQVTLYLAHSAQRPHPCIEPVKPCNGDRGTGECIQNEILQDITKGIAVLSENKSCSKGIGICLSEFSCGFSHECMIDREAWFEEDAVSLIENAKEIVPSFARLKTRGCSGPKPLVVLANRVGCRLSKESIEFDAVVPDSIAVTLAADRTSSPLFLQKAILIADRSK